MADQTVGFGTDAALSECAFTVKGYHFAGWKGSDGNTYKDGAADVYKRQVLGVFQMA